MSRARDSSSGTPSASGCREPGSQHGDGDAVAGGDLPSTDDLGGQFDAELRGDVLRRRHVSASSTRALSPGRDGVRVGQSDQQGAAAGPVGGRTGGGHHGPGAGPGGDQAEGLQAGGDFGGGGQRDAELRGDLAAGWQHVAVLQPPVADLLAVVLDDLHVRRVPLQRRSGLTGPWCHSLLAASK